MIDARLTNPRFVHELLREERKRISGAVKPLIATYGQLLRRDIIRSMVEEPKTGRIYTRPGGRLHQASAPGEAPARDTGKLIDSMKVRMSDAGWTAVVGASAPYARYLEQGTSRMLPRPAWEPARQRIEKPFIMALRRALEG